MASNQYNPINILDTSNATSVTDGGSMTLGGGISIGKDTYIGGNISISGTTTSFSDNILLVNKNPSTSTDTGIIFQRYTNDIQNNDNYVCIVYSEQNDSFNLGYLVSDAGRDYVSMGNLVSLNTKNITTGNINFTGDLYKNGTLYNPGSQWVTSNSDIYYTTGNVNTSNLITTNISGSNLRLSGDLYVGGTLSVVNVTTTNVMDINITTGTINVTGISNLNNATATNVSAGTITATNSMSTANLFYSNASAGTINVSTGITTGTLLATTSISSGSTSVSSGMLSATNATVTNVTATNVSSGSIIATTIVGSTSVSSGMLSATNATVTNVTATNVSSGSIIATTIVGSTSVSSGMLSATNATVTNVTATNVSSGSINATTIVGSTSVSSGLLSATNIVGTNISAGTLSGTTITGANLSLSGNLIVGGTLTTVNITSTNILNTNISVGTIIATGLSALQNVTLTNVSAGTINASTMNLSTGITAASAQITNENVTTSTIATARITSNLISLGNSNTVGNIFTTGGNVGINTTAPGAQLTVNGDIRVTPTAAGNNVGVNLLRSGTADWYMYNPTGSSNLRFYNSGDLMTLTSTGTLGIGTTSPGSSLHISTNSPGSNSNSLLLDNSNSRIALQNWSYTGNSKGTLRLSQNAYWDAAGTTTLYNTALSAWSIEMGTNTDSLLVYRFNTAGSSSIPFCIASSGNVGINTGSPSYLLNIQQDNTGAYPGDTTTGQLIISGATDSTKRFGFQLDTVRNYGHIQVIKAGTSNYPLILNGLGGSVGINTTSPSEALSVNGNIRLGPATDSNVEYTIKTSGQMVIAANDASSQDSDYAALALQAGISSNQSSVAMVGSSNTSYQYITLSTTNTERMRITRTGNVGIGTAAPAYTLDVAGTIARSGVRLPRFDNGTFSSASSAVIPILFSDSTYNYVEIKVRFTLTATCNVTLSGNSAAAGNGSTLSIGENGETTVKYNAQGSPVYTNSSYIAQTAEGSSPVDYNFTIKITRSTSSSVPANRNHFLYDTVYTWSNVGTSRVTGMGHFLTSSNQLLSILMTPGSGTISGTYSTQHSY